MLDLNELRLKMNSLTFQELDQLKLGDALNLVLPYLFKKKSLLRNLISFIAVIFFNSFEYTQQYATPTTMRTVPMFLFSHSYSSRSDHKNTFDKIVSLFQYKKVVVGETCRRRFSLNKIVLIPIYVKWLKVIKQNFSISFAQRLWMVKYLMIIGEYIHQIDRLDSLSGISSLITYFDASMCDNIIAQLCRNQDIPTATLQHGHFLAKNDDGTKGIAFDGFVSDQMFVWGEYTKLEAIEAGIPEEVIKVVGCPKYIGLKRPEPKMVTDIRTIGVVLEGGTGNSYLRDANYQMVQTVVQYAEATGCSLLIKPHPVSNNDYLKPLLANKANIHFTEKIMPVADFASSVDIAVAMGSTVYAELLYLGVIVFRFLSTSAPDRYKRIAQGTFPNVETLTESINELKANPEEFAKTYKEIASFLIEDVDTGQSYINSINNLIIQ